MENVNKVCRLCLIEINYRNMRVMNETIFQTLDIIELKIVRKSVQEEDKPVMCSSCCIKLFAAFEFKAICTDNEDIIFPYLHYDGMTLMTDLRKIYQKERNKEYLKMALEDERICRLCMVVIVCEFTSVKDVEADLLCNYIPQIDFSVTKDPVICATCLNHLHTHNNFLKHCLAADKEFKRKNSNSENYLVDKGLEVCKTKEEQTVKSDLPKKLYILLTDNIRGQVKQKSISQRQTFKCNACNFQTKHKKNIKRHGLVHKELWEVQTFKCNKCSYQTKYKGGLVEHRLTHQRVSKAKVYECHTCSFKTKRRSNFVSHQLVHKNMSEAKRYKCYGCDFTTKYKPNLRRHLLKDKDTSYTQMRKCNRCSYETANNECLIHHRLQHKVRWYKCDACRFKTKYQPHLTRHRLIHQSKSEVRTYRCYTCNFETKHKDSLREHVMIHTDVSDERLLKCYSCNYQTFRKSNLRRHQIIHNRIRRADIEL